ncbi:MAG TPA: CHAT domain-containing tetratricopeptide repeat protein [Leptolyngbyaceae cyanobacterium]
MSYRQRPYSFYLSLRLSCLGVGAALVSIYPSAFAQTVLPTDFDQGLAAYQVGDFHQAINYWRQTLNSAATPNQQAQTWGNLAIAYYETGQYRQALDANETALALFTQLGQETAVGQVQSNLANVYEGLGEYDRALQLYQGSLVVAQNTHNRKAEGISLGNMAYVYFVQGEQAKALDAYTESLAIARETGDREGESHRLLNLAIAHHTVNEIAKAETFYRQSLAVAQAIGHQTLEARALGNLGMAEADQGKYDVAINHYKQSLAISQAIGNLGLSARTLNNLGHTLLAANQLEEAEASLRAAISNLDALRSGLGDALNVSVFDTQIYSYNLLQQVLVAQDEPEAALEVSEAGRSRAFTDLLSNRSSSSKSVRSANPIAAEPITIAQIRQLAQQEQTTLVEYSLVPEEEFRVQGKQRGRTAEIHIWVVQPDGTITFRRSPIARQQQPLETLIETSRDAMGTRSRASILIETTTPVASQQNLQTLHQLLIEPIQDLLPANPEDPVVIVPHGNLFLVPFPALMTKEGDYLIQHHTLLTAPSLQTLALTNQREQAAASRSRDSGNLLPDNLLIVGNPHTPQIWDPQSRAMVPLSPLAGAEQEATKIAGFLETAALTENNASEKVVKQRIGQARIVHLATHGLLEYGNPQESGVRDMPGAIALTPGEGEDGLLTSAEILEELDLKADLVVLSACDTGRGDITGDGVIGLSRSLLAAGASNVVVSLWAVPDAPTAELMIEFYRHLELGQSKAQALRQAMLSTMQQHPEPKDWAAFTLIGAAE